MTWVVVVVDLKWKFVENEEQKRIFIVDIWL